MVLSIKIRDNIVIPKENTGFWYGKNFFEAEKLLKKKYQITDNESFTKFEKILFENFEVLDAYNSYYLADSITIAKALKNYLSEANNYLHFLGIKIKKYPTKKQFKVLAEMQANNLIEYFWIEGEIRQTDTIIPDSEETEVPDSVQPVGKIPPNNFYINDLALNDFEMRGKDATIIVFEQNGTDKIADLASSNPYLSHFSNRQQGISRVAGPNTKGDFSHQIRTLVTIFAKTQQQGIFHLDGLADQAELGISSIEPLKKKAEYLPTIRKLLADLMIDKRRNIVLLLEFEVEVIDGKAKKRVDNPFYPILIFKDIANQLTDLVQNKNFIILLGAGNGGLHFDTTEDAPWKMKTQVFNDLTKNHPSVLMIGAAKKENEKFVKAPFNQSDSFDAYLYTNFFVGKKANSFGSASYGGTSGAVAIAAGVVTCLQGKAISEKKILTTEIVKKVFRKTFMKDYPEPILTPTTLEDLWKACEKEMASTKS